MQVPKVCSQKYGQYSILIFFFLWSLINIQWANAQVQMYGSPLAQSMADQEQFAHGRALYLRRCSGCHGVSGDGQGPAAFMLNPKPRDFTKGIFKFTDIAPGEAPSNKRLAKTLQNGIKHSSMPSYAELDFRELQPLISYIRSFNQTTTQDPSQWLKLATATPIIFEPLPMEEFKDGTKFYALAKQGRVLYQQACLSCHGSLGDGNGPVAADLIDDFDQPIRPANLRLTSIKRGKSVKDIYETLIFGVNGTPMVSFKDAYQPQELFALTAFVFFLRGEEAGIYADHLKLTPVEENKE